METAEPVAGGQLARTSETAANVVTVSMLATGMASAAAAVP